jgi:glycerol-3-phosphate acyltransferase PlsY
VSATLFVLVVWLTRYVSLGSVLATMALPPLAFFTDKSVPVVIGAGLAALLIVQRHRANLTRLQQGVEPRLGTGPRA